MTDILKFTNIFQQNWMKLYSIHARSNKKQLDFLCDIPLKDAYFGKYLKEECSQYLLIYLHSSLLNSLTTGAICWPGPQS